jgi:4-aminobutyrate--pyruvate transaminase
LTPAQEASLRHIDRSTNYRNEAMLLGFSDLARLARERPLVLAKGSGVMVYDEHGRDYIETVSSFYCASLGFSDEELIEAANTQMRALPMYPSAAHRTVPVVMELAERLAAIAPIRNAKIAFATTGSEANDHLIKFMWYGNGFAGQPVRRKLISRWGSYHGGTIATSALGGSSDLHTSFAVPTNEHLHVSHPNWPGGAKRGESEEAYSDRLAAELESAIETAGPETVGAFIAEPMSVSAGMLPPPAGYFAKMKSVLDRHGIQLFVDEVVTGFGRTGAMWGSETVGAEPDCITCSKAMSGAYAPISAIVMSEEFYARLMKGSDEKGWFAHAGTYHAHPVAAAVALKVLDIFQTRNILGHVRSVLSTWQRHLQGLEDHPLVSGTRHFGLAAGIELAQGQQQAVQGSLKVAGLAKQVYEAGLAEGVIVRPLATCLVMAPPLIITEAEIAELFARLRRALDRTLRQQSTA